jgi:hypothetical protein
MADLRWDQTRTLQHDIERVAAPYRVWGLTEDKIRLVYLRQEVAIARGHAKPLSRVNRVRLTLASMAAGFGRVQTPITLRYRV